MTSEHEAKPKAQDMVEAKTPGDPENEKLTLEELAVVTGGGDDDVFGGTSQGPDWGNND